MSDFRGDKNLMGKASEYRVMAELLIRGILATMVSFDNGFDIFTNSGARIQVRSRVLNKNGRATIRLIKNRDYEFLIIWIRNTDIFYIIPKRFLGGESGIGVIPKKGKKYFDFVNRWNLLR